MPANPFDQACRYLTKADPEGALPWLLRLPPAGLGFDGWLDTPTLPFPGEPERTCDTVASLRDTARGGVPWAVVVEFQVEPDPDMFGRLLVYLGRLWLERGPSPERGDRFELGAVVVNLTGAGRSSRRMDWPEAGLLTQV